MDPQEISDEEAAAYLNSQRAPETISPVEQTNNWGALDGVRQKLSEQFPSESLFSMTGNLSPEKQPDGRFEDSGIRGYGAGLIDLLGGLGGSIGGAGAGTVATGGNPVSGWLGGMAGSELGYLGANELNKFLGLRPDTPENSLSAELEPSRVGPRVATAAVAPLAVGAGAKAVRGAIDRPLVAADRLVNFLDPDTQLARAFTDNPKKIEESNLLPNLQILKDNLLSEPSPRAKLIGKDKDNSFNRLVERIKGQGGELNRVGSRIDEIADEAEARLTALQNSKLSSSTDVKEVDLADIVRGAQDDVEAPYRVKLKDIVNWDDLRKQDELALGNERSAATAVSELEFENFAREALKGEPDLLARYRAAQKSNANLEARAAKAANGEISIDAEEFAKMESQRELNDQLIADVENRVSETEFSIKDLRRWKTRFYDNARFDRVKIPDNIEAQRSETYKALGNAFQDAFVNTVSKASPELAEELALRNREYKALIDILPLAQVRANEAALGGRYHHTGQFKPKESPGILYGALKSFYPEIETPESRFLVGTGQLSRGPSRAMAGMAKAGTAAIANTADALSGAPRPATPGKYLAGINAAANVFSPEQANASVPVELPSIYDQPRLPVPQIQPSQDGLMSGMRRLQQELPALIGEEDANNVMSVLSPAIQNADKDPDKVGQVMVSLLRNYPEARTLFRDEHPDLPVYSFGGKVYTPIDYQLMDQHIERSSASSIEKAKALSALNRDGTVVQLK